SSSLQCSFTKHSNMPICCTRNILLLSMLKLIGQIKRSFGFVSVSELLTLNPYISWCESPLRNRTHIKARIQHIPLSDDTMNPNGLCCLDDFIHHLDMPHNGTCHNQSSIIIIMIFISIDGTCP
uniref:Uncharacterized protein n=2 Tax=Cyprinus carpio TaxID=7962 RepID=A0A9J7YY35_CYPCA